MVLVEAFTREDNVADIFAMSAAILPTVFSRTSMFFLEDIVADIAKMSSRINTLISMNLFKRQDIVADNIRNITVYF
jgi:hypothetical protein